jgi:hypothetical protein
MIKLSLYKYVECIYYLIIRPFEKGDFPNNIKRISIQYCMIDQNLHNLPVSVEEVSFYQNIDNIDLSILPKNVKIISFEYYINQNIIDNLPSWIQELNIYFRLNSFCNNSLSFDNLPVGLRKLKFCNNKFVNMKLDLLPANCVVT